MPLNYVCKHVADGTWPAISVVRHTRITNALAVETRLCVQCCDAVSDLLAGLGVEDEAPSATPNSEGGEGRVAIRKKDA